MRKYDEDWQPQPVRDNDWPLTVLIVGLMLLFFLNAFTNVLRGLIH